MKENLKRAIWIAVTAAMIVGLVATMTYVTKNKEPYRQYSPYFTEQENFDVLYFGTSHTMCSVLPMEQWREYGIASYNLGISANRMPETYWTIVNALDYSTPKLIVLDCFYMNSPDKTFSIGQVHLFLDAFPLTLNKLRAIYSLSRDNSYISKENEAGLLFKFLAYRQNWSTLDESSFDMTPSTEKGARMLTYVSVPETSEKTDKLPELEGSVLGIEYLHKIIDLCEEKNIDLLLVYFPFPADEGRYEEANLAGLIAQEEGIDYINFLDMGVVDYDIDCNDSNSHLNAAGARKLTSWLGEYIQDNYDIPDRRGDAAYAYWNNDYESYTEYKRSCITEAENVYAYLMLINDAELSVRFALRDGSQLAENGTVQKLLAALPEDGGDKPVLPDGADLYVEVTDRSGNILNELCASFMDDELVPLTKIPG